MAGPSRSLSRPSTATLGVAGFALAYFGLTWFSSLFIHEPEGIAGIWPASGLALVAMLVTSRRLWPLLAVIVVAANLRHEHAVRTWRCAPAFGFSLVNTVEPRRGGRGAHRRRQAVPPRALR